MDKKSTLLVFVLTFFKEQIKNWSRTFLSTFERRFPHLWQGCLFSRLFFFTFGVLISCRLLISLLWQADWQVARNTIFPSSRKYAVRTCEARGSCYHRLIKSKPTSPNQSWISFLSTQQPSPPSTCQGSLSH